MNDYDKSVLDYMVICRDMRGNPPTKLKYHGNEDFVLRHGAFFPFSTLPEKYEEHRGEFKQCFMNAFNLALAFPDELTYVEGYAAGIIPCMHAWCVDKQGNAYDPTWMPDTCHSYFGVPFELDYVIKILVEKETYGMLENYEMDFPLLTGEHDVETDSIIVEDEFPKGVCPDYPAISDLKQFFDETKDSLVAQFGE